MSEAKIIELYRGTFNPTEGEVGIEIEMEGTNLPEAPSGWRHAADGSIGMGGLEYVLYRPVTHDKVERNLVNLQTYLASSPGCTLQPSERCGVHVHVNVQQMTFKQVINYACLYLIFEEPLIRWCGEDRIGNLFCLDTGSADLLVERLIHAIPYGTFIHSFGRDQYRYASVNFDAIGKYGSLEFRAMRTHAEFVRPICTWVDTLMRIKNESLTFKDVLTTVSEFSVASPVPFARRILGPLYDVYNCDGIEEMLMNGVRRVQDVAYAEQIKSVVKAPEKKKSHWDAPAGAGPVDLEPQSHNYNTISKYTFDWNKWALRNRELVHARYHWWGEGDWNRIEADVRSMEAEQAEREARIAPPPPRRDEAGRFASRAIRIEDMQDAMQRFAEIGRAEARPANPPRARRARRVEAEDE